MQLMEWGGPFRTTAIFLTNTFSMGHARHSGFRLKLQQ